MFRENWYRHPKAGLVGGILSVLVLCVVFIILGNQVARYDHNANVRVQEYAEYTSRKVAETCVRIPSQDRIACLNEAFEAQREYENIQVDLAAQNKSALWASVMGAAAVIGMFLSAVGVFLVKTTFNETRKAADAAVENLRIYREAERAFLKPVGVELFEIESQIRYGFEIIFENNGRSYAEIYKMSGFVHLATEW